MTVQELIYILEKFDPQWTVVTTTDDADYFTDIKAEQFSVERQHKRQRQPQLYKAETFSEEVILIRPAE